jgi:hypothetical protein
MNTSDSPNPKMVDVRLEKKKRYMMQLTLNNPHSYVQGYLSHVATYLRQNDND